MEMKVPAKADYVGVIRLSISGVASRMGFSYEAIEDWKVAISEAVTNVVSHAYEKKETGEGWIGFAVYQNRLQVMVWDQGGRIRVEEIGNCIGAVDERDMVTDVSRLREGGFGLFLINALMDKVEINNEYGVIVVMTKYLDEPEVGLNDEVPSQV